MTTAAATIWPATVAIAAPAMPSRGSPSSPKMSSGSSTMFVTAPRIWAIIGVRISPSACKILVQTLSRKSPKLATETMRP